MGHASQLNLNGSAPLPPSKSELIRNFSKLINQKIKLTLFIKNANIGENELFRKINLNRIMYVCLKDAKNFFRNPPVK